MKKLVLFLLIGISLIGFQNCSQVEPIVQDVCEITTEICNYANLLCSQFKPDVLTKSEQDELKKELLNIKQKLEARLSEINIKADLKKNEKNKLLFYVESLKKSVKEITDTIDQTELANDIN